LLRNCLITAVAEGKIERKRRRGGRYKQLLDDHRGKEKALDYTDCRTRFGIDLDLSQ
jgi:hypothetical protein